MTTEVKYILLAIAALLIIVPLGFLAIKGSVFLLGLLFNYPGYVVTAILGMFAGSALTKLSK